MTESALKNWGAEKGEPGDKAAVEADLVGGDSAFGQEGPFEEEHLAGGEPSEAGPAPAAKGAKKNKKPLLIGLSIAAVLLVGAAAFKKSQQHTAGQMVPATGSEESVEAAVARPGASPQDQGAAVVATPSPGEAQIAPVLGAEPSAEASAPAGAVVAPAQSASMPVISQAPAAPTAAGGRNAYGQGVAVAAPAQTAAAPSPEALAVQEAQKQLVASLQSDVAELRKTVVRLQGELASRPAVQVAAAPKAPAPRPQRAPEPAPKTRAAEPAPVAAPQTAAPVSAAPVVTAAQSKGKVRTDYRIYAMVEGRVWVKQGDNEAEMVDIRSPLLDGSTVLSIDPAKPAVVTSAGEIRTR